VATSCSSAHGTAPTTTFIVHLKPEANPVQRPVPYYDEMTALMAADTKGSFARDLMAVRFGASPDYQNGTLRVVIPAGADPAAIERVRRDFLVSPVVASVSG
jgi:hypothetical protein